MALDPRLMANPVAANLPVFAREEQYRQPIRESGAFTFRYPGFGHDPEILAGGGTGTGTGTGAGGDGGGGAPAQTRGVFQARRDDNTPADPWDPPVWQGSLEDYLRTVVPIALSVGTGGVGSILTPLTVAGATGTLPPAGMEELIRRALGIGTTVEPAKSGLAGLTADQIAAAPAVRGGPTVERVGTTPVAFSSGGGGAAQMAPIAGGVDPLGTGGFAPIPKMRPGGGQGPTIELNTTQLYTGGGGDSGREDFGGGPRAGMNEPGGMTPGGDFVPTPGVKPPDRSGAGGFGGTAQQAPFNAPRPGRKPDPNDLPLNTSPQSKGGSKAAVKSSGGFGGGGRDDYEGGSGFSAADKGYGGGRDSWSDAYTEAKDRAIAEANSGNPSWY